MTCVDACGKCPYNKDEDGRVRRREECVSELYNDIMQMVEDYKNVIELLGGLK
jgi:hypothetical protein